MLLLAFSACTWISDDEVGARLDVDGDGVPFPDDCDDGNPELTDANVHCLGPTDELCPPADCALDASGGTSRAMSQVGSLVVADLDGDGLAEVAAANATEVHVFGGRELATGGQGVTVLAGGGPLATVDLDDNGVADLVLAGPGMLRVGVGPWGASEPWEYVLSADPALGSDVAGGPSGLVVGATSGADAWLVPGLHGATSIADEGVSLERPGEKVADPGDLDGDGTDDIALATGADIEIDLAGGNTTISDLAELLPRTVGDLDGDGRDDLGVGEPSAGKAAVLVGPWTPGILGIGDGWLQFEGNGAGGSLSGAALDGPALVVTADAGAYLLVDLVGGTVGPDDAAVTVPGARLAATGDLDGDGRDDLVAADSGQVLVFFANDL